MAMYLEIKENVQLSEMSRYPKYSLVELQRFYCTTILMHNFISKNMNSHDVHMYEKKLTYDCKNNLKIELTVKSLE